MKKTIIIVIILIVVYFIYKSIDSKKHRIKWTYGNNGEITGYINDSGIWIKKP